MAGDTAEALAAYKDFLTLWKDADPGIPILKQARRSTRSCSDFTALGHSLLNAFAARRVRRLLLATPTSANFRVTSITASL